MYLDSNILLAQILNNQNATRAYADAALRIGGIVCSEVLVEVFAKAERETRTERKATTGEFGPAAEKAYKRELAELVLSWQQSGKVCFLDSSILSALVYMKETGLDYVDCLLINCGEQVATSDKDMIKELGNHRWQAG